jgi:multiple sugar transport system substrate-binding protein
VPFPSNKPNDKAWDWQAYLEAAKKITKTEGDRTTVFGTAVSSGVWDWPTWMRSNGVEWINPDTGAIDMDKPAAIEALQFLADLRWKHKVGSYPAGVQSGVVTDNDLFMTGKVAMIATGSWLFDQYRPLPFDWDVTYYPLGKDKTSAYLFCFPNMCWSKTKDPELAWSALRYIIDEGSIPLIKGGNISATKLSHLRQYFVQPDKKPENATVFVDMVENWGKPYPLLLTWREFLSKMDSELDALWIGKKSAEEVVQSIKKTCEPMSKEGLWRSA